MTMHRYRNHTPAVVAVSGMKNAGKTTLIANMLPLFQAAGIKTAVIKHDGHSFEADPPGTDTGRFIEAGACGTAIFDGSKYKVIKPQPLDEHALLAMFPEADLILMEGLKYSRWPKIEVVRADNYEYPVCDGDTLLAIVTDLPLVSQPVPLIGLDDTAAAVQCILQYMNHLRGETASYEPEQQSFFPDTANPAGAGYLSL